MSYTTSGVAPKLAGAVRAGDKSRDIAEVGMLRSLLFAIVSAAWGAGFFAASPARAQEVAMSGSFTASQACPALQSIRRRSNPGEVRVEPGHAYRLLGRNRQDATFYRIVIEGAQPTDRWVPVDCGQAGGAWASGAWASGASASGASASGTAPSGAATAVLALGWEPAFCQQHRDKAECAEGGDATRLSLHGLWPQPRGRAYCGVPARLAQTDRAHDWAALPKPDIGPATRQRLAAVMPGVASGLERHEWIVHGTCFGGSADGYFARAASLTEEVNASPVRRLFVQNVGGTVSADAIRAAFDQAFGPGAGSRVTVSCVGQGSGRRISELVVSLAGDLSGAAPLGRLIQSAPPAPPGCPSGTIQR